MNPPTPARPWRVVAEEVSHERDGHRIAQLIEELLRALRDEHHPNDPKPPERRELPKLPNIRRSA